MGNYLRKPQTDKKTIIEKSLQNDWFCAASIMQGWRISQEDAYDFNLNFIDGSAFFAVYDGHGGAGVCNYVKLMLPKVIQENWDSADIPKTLITSFLQLDSSLLSDNALQEIKKLEESNESCKEPVSKEDVMAQIKAFCYEDDLETDSEDDDDDDCSSENDESSVNGDDNNSTDDKNSNKSNLNNESLDANLNEKCKEHETERSLNSEAKITCTSEGQDANSTVSEEKAFGNTIKDDERTDSKDDYKDADSSFQNDENSVNGDDNNTDDKISNEDNLNNKSFDANLNENCEEHEAERSLSSKDQDLNSTVTEAKDHKEKVKNIQTNFSELSESCEDLYNPVRDSGCTASVVIIHKDIVHCAHVGDSYCYLYETGAVIPLCEEVTPESPSELQRITKAGGTVSEDGRVNDQLNLSRALGDFCFKENKELPPEEQMISPMPFVKSVPVTKEFKFIILASDGIWNSSKNVHDYLKCNFDNDGSYDQLPDLVENLFDECLEKRMTSDGTGCDNMTAILVSNQSVLKENGSPVAKKPRLT